MIKLPLLFSILLLILIIQFIPLAIPLEEGT